MPFHLIALVLLSPCANPTKADDEVAALLKDLRAVSSQGAGSPAARTAWDKLVARGPAVLPRILEAMDTPDTVVANWLRTAFDRIVATELKNGGQRIDDKTLLLFAKDAKRQGRARRLALEVVEQLRPGTSEQLIPGWLDDPEFRYEAVTHGFKKAEALDTPRAKTTAYRILFDATRDLGQAKQVAARLKDLDTPVSIADHLGFLSDWYVMGPFDAKGMKGFKTVYPPEQKIDLKAQHDGKEGKIGWKRFIMAEPPPLVMGDRGMLINLCQPLGNAEDAVAYAYTAFRVPMAREVEFRGAGDDNFTVWVNGERAFGFEEYRNGVRLDRHRFKVKLKDGVNTVLVKICQAPLDASNMEPNWEFLLRVVDPTGKGIEMGKALPDEKK